MTVLDARTRVRQRIRRLLEDQGKTNRALAKWVDHREQWVSNMLAGRVPLSLDEIDRVALFLNVPASELVRHSEDPWELSPTEMRMVRALRMLPTSVRDHLVTLADYLIGVTPDEADILTKIRQLTDDEKSEPPTSDTCLPVSQRGRLSLPDLRYPGKHGAHPGPSTRKPPMFSSGRAVFLNVLTRAH